MNWRKYMIEDNWNIGFCEQIPEELIQSYRLNKVQWLKHPYRDRWFADPFILKVTEKEIVVFVEECMVSGFQKGIICELVINRKTLQLKERHVLLELDTHLSYPAIIRNEGKVYVYPENGRSGRLNLYEYNEVNHTLENPICILDEPVADATIIKTDGVYKLIATLYPETQEKAYLYESETLFGPYRRIFEDPCQLSRSFSRPGGGWISLEEGIYRPAQDCSKRYGGALNIMKVNFDEFNYRETPAYRINPNSLRYSRGVHTINFSDGLCVIDGYGYLYQIAGRFFMFLKILKGLVK